MDFGHKMTTEKELDTSETTVRDRPMGCSELERQSLADSDPCHEREDSRRRTVNLHTRNIRMLRGFIQATRGAKEKDKETLRRWARQLETCTGELIEDHCERCGERRKLYRSRHCKNRHCARCRAIRQAKAFGKLLPLVQEAMEQGGSFLTLTVKNGMNLRERDGVLRRAWTRLRKDEWFKAKVQAGIYNVEYEWRPGTGGWGPHMHIVCRGAIHPRDEPALRELWRGLTGDGSYQVRVKGFKDDRSAAQELLKYNTKDRKDGSERKLTDDPQRLRELALFLHGRRLLQPFGEWFNRRLRDADLDPQQGDDELIGIGDLETEPEPHQEDPEHGMRCHCGGWFVLSRRKLDDMLPQWGMWYPASLSRDRHQNRGPPRIPGKRCENI